jgi:hypothetical protein
MLRLCRTLLALAAAAIEAAGFRFLEEVKLTRENYFLRFARD